MNYYKILQVDHEADTEVIQAAYRRLSHKYHPDKSDQHNAKEYMAQINEAYEILSDPIKRNEYDEQLSKKKTSSGNSNDDVFSEPMAEKQKKTLDPIALAKAQRRLIYAVAAYFAMLGLIFLASINQIQFNTYIILAPVILYICFVSFMASRELRHHWIISILWAVAMAVLLNFTWLLLLVLSYLVTKKLESLGLPVGLFGVKKEDLNNFSN